MAVTRGHLALSPGLMAVQYKEMAVDGGIGPNRHRAYKYIIMNKLEAIIISIEVLAFTFTPPFRRFSAVYWFLFIISCLTNILFYVCWDLYTYSLKIYGAFRSQPAQRSPAGPRSRPAARPPAGRSAPRSELPAARSWHHRLTSASLFVPNSLIPRGGAGFGQPLAASTIPLICWYLASYKRVCWHLLALGFLYTYSVAVFLAFSACTSDSIHHV